MRGHDDIAAVLERHFEAVYAYVAYRVAPDWHAAADITQDVFCAAAAGLSSFRGDSSVLTWLRSLARRKVADHYRSLDRQRRAVELYKASCPAALPTHDGSSSDEVRRVVRTMQALPEGQVELLELKYLEGQSVRQIAAQHGQTEKAVESALSRARAAFRQQYQCVLQVEEDEP